MSKLNISYFMPAFNCAGTVRESVLSILEANFEPGDELVVVDDGSHDETMKVLSEFERVSGVRVLRHPTNRGGAAARNTAVRSAVHPLLFCLDSDNVLVPGSVRPLAEFLVAYGADVAAFQELWYFKTRPGEVTHKWTFPPGEVTLADCLSKTQVPGASGNYLFTRASWERAGGYPEAESALDTWGFGFRQLATGSRMVVLEGTHYHHRYGHESYWVRESRKTNLSLVATEIVRPYVHLLLDEDAAYVLSRRGRKRWQHEIDSRPIRLRAPGAEPRPPPSPLRGWVRRIASLVGR